MTEPGDPPGKTKKLVNGKKIFKEAVKHYREGGGSDLWVDASTLDLSYVSQQDLILNKDGSYSVNLIEVDMDQEASLALGKISLDRVGDSNHFKIRSDKYDFNIEWSNLMTKRNLFTAGAYILHHSNIGNYKMGTVYSWNFSARSFWIKFQNSTYIKP
ncbi:hypothetical protein [Chryseobacterium sp. MFBS3-17]|uniref:hypothetical protein n=1 Tax=Chryseobacterium sp. MFBS3-17 TaxID=2886689 RepID=UPI001D0EAEB5|nr:hypothetical protein [Chryseobacterium sp. MFBS3-17]MCC2590604.1 hypothetical protein [Chryseobacterium sp. MFBS3-17]